MKIAYIVLKGMPLGGGIEKFTEEVGEILPCNVIEERMGNLKEQTFAQIWNGDAAAVIRQKVKNCRKNCWMIGSVNLGFFAIPMTIFCVVGVINTINMIDGLDGLAGERIVTGVVLNAFSFSNPHRNPYPAMI